MLVENRKSLATAAAVTGVVAAAAWFVQRMRRKARLPPGPTGWPLIGNLDVLKVSKRKAIEAVLTNLAEKYGDMATVSVGPSMDMVIIIKPELVQEGLLSKQLSDRGASFFSLEYLTEGMNSIFSAPNTERWRYHRKASYAAFRMFAQTERLDQLIIDSFDSVSKYFLSAEPADVYETIYLVMYNLQSRITFSKEYTAQDPEFIWLRESFEELNQTFQSGLLVDLIPVLRYLPWGSCRSFMKTVDGVLAWSKKLIDERKRAFNPSELNDILDFLIKEQRTAIESGQGHLFQDVHLRQTLMDIFLAGTDTTAMTLYWLIWALCDHPEMQERCYAEVSSVIGDSTPQMSDREKLPYTDAFLHEVMRYWPLVLQIPRQCYEDCTIGGRTLPRGTTVLLSIYNCHFNPSAFPDPSEFKPEHFLTDDGRLSAHKRGFLPFGAGSRVCLGESIAKRTTFLLTVSLIQSFKFVQCPEFKGSDGFSENGSLGFVLPKRFKVRVVPRKGV